MQVGRPLAGVVQRCPQEPQLVGSEFRSRHEPAQKVVPPVQELAHAPIEQTWPAGQTVPHVPQLELVVRLVSQPLSGSMSQFPKPGLQAPSVHRPAVQVGDALSYRHTVRQLPHAVGVVLRLVSQPFVGSSSQSP